jgi:hypothetical protein
VNRKERICVEITGGLGNQLFQLTAATSLRNSSQESVLIDWSLGRPRLNSNGLPDLFGFELPDFVKIGKKKRWNWLPRKTFGYLLRMGYSPRSYELKRSVSKILKAVGELILFVYFGTKRVPLVSENLGFSKIQAPTSRFILVGYFQSYKYLENYNISSTVKNIRPKEKSSEIDEIKETAKQESPLVVHFRFGDYLLESDFGIPDENYYLNAIRSEWRLGIYGKIWVFSDDLELAKAKFPREFIEHVRWIEPISKSSVLSLESMRFGKGYVIANSTFSYWAAILAYDEQVRVVAPTPWFRSTQSPSELTPKNWQLLPGWNKESDSTT